MLLNPVNCFVFLRRGKNSVSREFVVRPGRHCSIVGIIPRAFVLKSEEAATIIQFPEERIMFRIVEGSR